MSVVFKRTVTAENILKTEIYDNKFKTYAVKIRLTVPFVLERNPLYSIAFEMLSTTNRKYPEREDLSRALTDLYSASISYNAVRTGGNYSYSLTLNCLCDEYTIGREVISDKAADILLDCLLDPVLDNGVFPSKNFELCRKDILDDIESVINNKRQYSLMLARKYIYEGESSAYSPYDYKPFVEAATPESVTDAYYELLDSAVIGVDFIGGSCSESLKERVISKLASIGRNPAKLNANISPSPLKNEVLNKEESIRASQCQLVLAYKTEDYNEYASKLYMAMLGASTTSKLFTNVREKLSLCYYCDSILNDLKHTFLISSGLEYENLDKAIEAIKAQITAMRNGDFTDEELYNAKAYLSEAYLSNYDSKFDMCSWYFVQYLKGTNDSPEDKSRKVFALTREDIIKEAKAYKLDTVFVCRPERGGDDDEA